VIAVRRFRVVPHMPSRARGRTEFWDLPWYEKSAAPIHTGGLWQRRSAKSHDELRVIAGDLSGSRLKGCNDPDRAVAKLAADATTLLLPIDDAMRWLLWQRITCHRLL